MSNRSSGCGTLIFWLLVLVVISICTAVAGRSTVRDFDGTLVKTYVDRGNTYFVVLEDGKDESIVYENEDAWFFMKWNSGDILRDLAVGSRYHFTIYGWRVPFLSWFPNIVSATPIDD